MCSSRPELDFQVAAKLERLSARSLLSAWLSGSISIRPNSNSVTRDGDPFNSIPNTPPAYNIRLSSLIVVTSFLITEHTMNIIAIISISVMYDTAVDPSEWQDREVRGGHMHKMFELGRITRDWTLGKIEHDFELQCQTAACRRPFTISGCSWHSQPIGPAGRARAAPRNLRHQTALWLALSQGLRNCARHHPKLADAIKPLTFPHQSSSHHRIA